MIVCLLAMSAVVTNCKNDSKQMEFPTYTLHRRVVHENSVCFGIPHTILPVVANRMMAADEDDSASISARHYLA